MNRIFYIDTAGRADDSLILLDVREGDCDILITARGITHDNVEPMLTGELRTYNYRSDVTRSVGLIWDTSRVLVAWDGVGYLTQQEQATLQRAGFDLYNVPLDTDYSAVGIGGSVATHSGHGRVDAVVDFIMAYEAGELDDDEVTEGFQMMLDNGMVWNLQGSYQRTAQALLDAGLIRHRDKWAD